MCIRDSSRSINWAVDLTNYVMFATGEPNHAFNADSLSNKSIIVRKAQDGEVIKTLDIQELKLTSSNLVIADSEKSVALAGVIGGLDSSVQDDTTSIVFEAAAFDPSSVRSTAGAYSIRTESSMRFEKGIDPERASLATLLYAEKLLELNPDAKLVQFVDSFPSATKEVELELDKQFLLNRLGDGVEEKEMVRILESLGFSAKFKGELLQVKAPVWRSQGDVSYKEDIVEEIARIIGYDNLESVVPVVKIEKAVIQSSYNRGRQIAEYLAKNAGFYETITYPWSHTKFDKAFGLDDSQMVALADAPAPENKFLKTSLLPNLFVQAHSNTSSFDSFGFFETSRVFLNSKTSEFSALDEKLPCQPKMLAACVVGKKEEEVYFRLKGALENLLLHLNLNPVSYTHLTLPTICSV